MFFRRKLITGSNDGSTDLDPVSKLEMLCTGGLALVSLSTNVFLIKSSKLKNKKSQKFRLKMLKK